MHNITHAILETQKFMTCERSPHLDYDFINDYRNYI